MQRIFRSKSLRTIGLVAMLTAIVGTSVQESLQAQVQSGNQPPDLVNCLPGFDAIYYDFQGITFTPQQESAAQRFREELNRRAEAELGTVQTDPNFGGGFLEVVMKEGLGSENDGIASEISEASDEMSRNNVPFRQQVELLTQRFGQYATFSTGERWLLSREQIAIRDRLKREFDAQMMSVFTPEQQAIYRANLEADRGLGTCDVDPTRSVSQQRPFPDARLTIAQVVSESGGQYDNNPEDFDILLNAVKQEGLVDALADQEANLTVFAPTDAAFLKLSRFFGYRGNDESVVLDVINQEFARMNQIDVARGGSDPNAFNLEDVLLYHVSSGVKTLDALQQLPGDRSMPTLLNWGDKPINANRISYVNGNLIDAAPNLIAPRIQPNLKDIPARNGVIQGIDRVLFPYFIDPVSARTQPQAGQPRTIADVLAQSGSGFDDNRQDFDILNKLLQTAEIADLFAAPNANLTLFAPTDAAFIEFAQATAGGAEQPPEDAEARAYAMVVDFIQRVDQVTTQAVFVGGDAVPLLQKALQYHASAGAKTAQEIQAASSINTLLNGAAITPQQGDRVPSSDFTNSQFQLGNTYVQTTNGVVQSIDNVLIPSIEQVK